jgi:hypothetical protein
LAAVVRGTIDFQSVVLRIVDVRELTALPDGGKLRNYVPPTIRVDSQTCCPSPREALNAAPEQAGAQQRKETVFLRGFTALERYQRREEETSGQNSQQKDQRSD